MLTEYEQYLEALCRKHKTLRHGAEGRRAWVPFGSENPATEKGKMQEYYMVHKDFSVDSIDEYTARCLSTLQVLTTIPSKGNTEAAINAARRATYKICEAFNTRFQNDMEEEGKCSFADGITNFEVKPVGPVDQDSYGWEIYLTFTKGKNDYDPDAWNEE